MPSLRRALLALLLTASAPAAAVGAGETAPPVMAPQLSSEPGAAPFSLAALRGKYVLIDFWASWCGPCKVSLPELNAMRAELHAAGHGARFEVLAINVDEKPDKALQFLARHPVDYPVVADPEGRYPEAYALPAMPSSYLIAPDGRVLRVHSGYQSGDAQKLKAELLTLFGAAR